MAELVRGRLFKIIVIKLCIYLDIIINNAG